VKPAAGANADEKVDRQSRILEAVLTLLSRHGISGVSMRSVAREAGVALGLVNYHYDDKVGLIKAALRRIEEQEDVALVEPDPTLPAEERPRSALRRVADPEFLSTKYLSLRLRAQALRGSERAHGHALILANTTDNSGPREEAWQDSSRNFASRSRRRSRQ
jgi:AcrR family transcriptional regulator